MPDEELFPTGDGFAAAGLAALGRVSDQPHPLKSGEPIVPRELMRQLAEVAADCPWTPPEISYELILRENFWTLAIDGPGDPEAVAFSMLLAMISMDRGGHVHAAECARTSWPIWRACPRIAMWALRFRLAR